MDMPLVSLYDRYYFELTEDIDAPTEEDLISDLDTIEADLNQIETKQREISGNVYSYSAPQKEVLSTHRKWNKEIGLLSSRLTECSIRIVHLHKGLLFLPFHSIRIPMRRIHQLKLKIGQSHTQIHQLSLVLQSPTYGEAIILYKKTLADCESIYDNYDEQRQQNELQKIHKLISLELEGRRKCLSTLPKELIVQIEIVYKEIIQLLEHASNLSPPSEGLDLFTCTILHLTQKMTITTQETQSVDLREDLSIYPGVGWMQKKVTKLANYSTITLIDSLEEEAKQLQIFHEAIESKLLATYQGDWKYIPQNYTEENDITSPDENFLKIRKLKLEQLCQSLYPLLSTKQIRTGLYYAARLFTYITEIHLVFTHFANNMSIQNKDIIAALNTTYECLATFLEANQNLRTTEKIESIFFAARSVATAIQLKNTQKTFPSPFNVQVLTHLETLIARLGREILTKPMDVDKQIWLAIVSKQTKHLSLSMGCHVEMNIKQHIEKEITQWLYFSKTPSHIRLDMMLHAVNRLKPAPSFFKELEFKQIRANYQPQHLQSTISIFCSIFELAYSFNTSMTEPYIFSYSECIAHLYMAKAIRNMTLDTLEKAELTQLIVEAEAQLELNRKESLHPLESSIEPSLEVMKDFITGKRDFTDNNHILLHLLAKSLWLLGDNKEESSSLLHDFFTRNKSDFFLLNPSEPINYLIAEFALTRANKNEPPCPFEDIVVKNILAVHKNGSIVLPKRLKEQCVKLSRITF